MNFSPAFFQLKLFKSENLCVSVRLRIVATVARHSMRRQKTGDKCCRFVQFSDLIAISLAVHGFHAGLQGYLGAIHR